MRKYESSTQNMRRKMMKNVLKKLMNTAEKERELALKSGDNRSAQFWYAYRCALIDMEREYAIHKD